MLAAIDAGALSALIRSVSDGFNAAPVWARTGLLVLLALAAVGGILRIAGTVAGRLLAVLVVAAAAALLVWGPAAREVLDQWWP